MRYCADLQRETVKARNKLARLSFLELVDLQEPNCTSQSPICSDLGRGRINSLPTLAHRSRRKYRLFIRLMIGPYHSGKLRVAKKILRIRHLRIQTIASSVWLIYMAFIHEWGSSKISYRRGSGVEADSVWKLITSLCQLWYDPSCVCGLARGVRVVDYWNEIQRWTKQAFDRRFCTW